MMSRKWNYRFLVWVVFSLVLFALHAMRGSAQTATPDPLFERETFGRLIDDVELLTGPRGTVIDDYQQGMELFIISTRAEADSYEVEMLIDGERGWAPIDQIELARAGSTGTVREYPGGWCTSTPTVARRMPGVRFYDRYQHELRFADAVNLGEIEEFSLVFNEQVRDFGYRLNTTTNALVLPATWVLAHSGFAPRWSDEGAWRLEWDCEEVSPLDDPNFDN